MHKAVDFDGTDGLHDSPLEGDGFELPVPRAMQGRPKAIIAGFGCKPASCHRAIICGCRLWRSPKAGQSEISEPKPYRAEPEVRIHFPPARSRVRTCAPSWVADFLSWWIDPESGLPIPERAGVLRYFIRVAESASARTANPRQCRLPWLHGYALVDEDRSAGRRQVARGGAHDGAVADMAGSTSW
jgi:hypothetical protein